MSKISDLYNKGDIKYFRRIHKNKQLAMGREYVSYPQFRRRLESGMTLKEAIYTPCVIHQRREHHSKTPIQDQIRRTQRLRAENVHVISLDDAIAYERQKQEMIKFFESHKQPKPTLRDRFISFFKRCQKRK